MPIRQVPDTDLHYHLVLFDENAQERAEPDGALASAAILSLLNDPARPITDVLIAAHGWKGDVPAAIEQYDRWIAATARASGDLERIRRDTPDFAPLVVGLHWPSLPWGVESVPDAAGADASKVLSATPSPAARTVDAISASIANTPAARDAIATVLKEAARATSDRLTPAMHDAYMTLFDEAGLRADGIGGRPGFDQERFDPQAIVAATRKSGAATTGGGTPSRTLGFGDAVKDAMLSPLRQLSFWAMKDRARRFGETAAHDLLAKVQGTSSDVRVHLMGHSFGCIVMSAMVAGPQNGKPLARAVDSLFLVQGALSLWSYGNEIPYAIGSSGYFHRIVADGLVRGPLITTRSVHDTAVGRFYPLGARIKGQRLLGATFPEYGGIGAFGVQGVAGERQATDMRMTAGDLAFECAEARIYNLDASDVIRNGDGPSGAHSDIAHPEVAHAFWAGVSGGIGIAKRHRANLAARPAADHVAPAAKTITRGAMLGGKDAPSAGSSRSSALDKQLRKMLGTKGAGAPPVAPATPKRWINASFEGHDPAAPLLPGNWYQLAFDVDVEVRFDGIGSAEFNEGAVADAGTGDVTLTVQIDTDDFDLSGRVSQMRVPLSGKGHTRARFDMSPLKNGPASIKATILRDGNFVQQMELSFEIGAALESRAKVATRGRPLSSSTMLRPRDIGLSIEPRGDGYDCIVWGPVSARARLPVTSDYLDSAIDAMRQALMSVVEQTENDDPVFQTRIGIPPEQSARALRTLASAGANLFIQLFEGAGAGADSLAVGQYLRRLVEDETECLKIQILAERLPIPWGLLYLGDASEDAPLDWNRFLGMRHIVEQIPLQPQLNVWHHGIVSNAPSLAISVNLNRSIDDAFPDEGFVRQQEAFWQSLDLGVTTRSSRADVLRALNSTATLDQILYFYCHAVSAGLGDPGGMDASCLELSDAAITLKDLRLNAPSKVQLPGKPLVFINACQSSKLSPMFYDGFVPYFMSKGARGVIGTECDTPAYFAMDWAQRFFERFLAGQPLGEAFLELRQHYLTTHGNPLGLLYAVHCDADTVIDPPRVMADSVKSAA
ncbi:CHAT domain protein [Caballeronia calidae]|uniref:CHAT domain protein n=1 Tax=Caballeronia calidae TaxID=1777139 RepID=A0A158BXY0_9BURK|nr:CHAT domain-containing protein [Caballeronia calidae]SAK74955.1 CHAT domain protein [Caballeronia calidae]